MQLEAIWTRLIYSHTGRNNTLKTAYFWRIKNGVRVYMLQLIPSISAFHFFPLRILLGR